MSIEKKPGENQEEVFTEEQIKEAEDFFLALDPTPEKPLTAEQAEQITEMAKRTKTTVAQKAHWRTKAEKAEAELIALDPSKKTVSPAIGAEKITPAEVLEFRLDQSLSKEDAKVVADEAKAHGISLEEAIKKPAIDAYLKSRKNATSNEIASVVPSRGGGGTAGAEVSDWSKISKEDMVKKRQSTMQRRNG